MKKLVSIHTHPALERAWTKAPHHPTRAIAAAFACALLTGCVSSAYKRAAPDVPPPVALNLAATRPPLAATLHTVIAFHGPGSWKRDAYWDEYVVSVTNTGDQPLVLDAAALADFRHRTGLSGDNPWELEKESLTIAERAERTENNLAVQIGAGVGVGLGGLTTAGVGTMAAMGGASAGVAAVYVGIVALPAYIVGTVVKNRTSRRDIEEEFHRRRLVLPATLAPGQTVQGSLFFRVSPGPQDLSLRARQGSERTIVTLDLKPLRGLHLRPAAGPTPPP